MNILDIYKEALNLFIFLNIPIISEYYFYFGVSFLTLSNRAKFIFPMYFPYKSAGNWGTRQIRKG